MSAAVSIAPRSLAETTRDALLIARELHEVHVERFTRMAEDGFYSDTAIQDARINVERSAALIEELMLQAQIVDQLGGVANDKHPLRAVQT